MTREEAITILKDISWQMGSVKRWENIEAIDMAIEALSQESSEDVISRQAAIEAIEIVDWYHQNSNKDMVHGANDDEHQAWYKADDVYKALEAVPSADRPRGEWIYWRENGIKRCKCSRCLTSYGCLDTPYCPNCGAKMDRERSEDE